MTTDAPVGDAAAAAPANQRWSRLAALSLLLSVGPLVSALAPLVAAAALVRLRRRPDLRGRGFAWAAIIVGPMTTMLTVAVVYPVYRYVQAMGGRPEAALRAAWDRDAEAFREQMTAPGNEFTAERLERWAAPLRDRLGPIRSVQVGTERPAEPATPLPQGSMLASYTGYFGPPGAPATVVPITVTFEPPAPGDQKPAIRIRRMALELPGGTRIVFPDDA